MKYTKQEINALEYRFKAFVLLCFQCNLMDIEEIDKGVGLAQIAFDTGDYGSCKKTLDLLGAIVVDILEGI